MSKKRHEVLDPTPVEWPLGITAPESLEQKIARMVRTSVSLQAQSRGMETFDEADDFDVDDEGDELRESVHELDDDQERISRDHAMIRRIPPEFRAAFEREMARRVAEQQKKPEPDKASGSAGDVVAKDLRATTFSDTKGESQNG